MMIIGTGKYIWRPKLGSRRDRRRTPRDQLLRSEVKRPYTRTRSLGVLMSTGGTEGAYE